LFDRKTASKLVFEAVLYYFSKVPPYFSDQGRVSFVKKMIGILRILNY